MRPDVGSNRGELPSRLNKDADTERSRGSHITCEGEGKAGYRSTFTKSTRYGFLTIAVMFSNLSLPQD